MVQLTAMVARKIEEGASRWNRRPFATLNEMRRAAAVLCCLASAACTSHERSTTTRERWCGAGGGAARGALVTVGGGAMTANIGGLVLGVLLSPVGAVIGGVDGAVNNRCPGTASTPAPPPSEARPAIRSMDPR